MSTFELSSTVERDRRIEGAVIVLGALLRSEEPAEAAAWLARVAAEAGIPCDLTLLGVEGDAARVGELVNGSLPLTTPSSWALGSGCELRVLESDPSC